MTLAQRDSGSNNNLWPLALIAVLGGLMVIGHVNAQNSTNVTKNAMDMLDQKITKLNAIYGVGNNRSSLLSDNKQIIECMNERDKLCDDIMTFELNTFKGHGIVYGVDQDKIRNMIIQYVKERGLQNTTGLNSTVPLP